MEVDRSVLPVCLESVVSSVPSFGQPAPVEAPGEVRSSAPTFALSIMQESLQAQGTPGSYSARTIRYSPDGFASWDLFNNGGLEENHRRGQNCAHLHRARNSQLETGCH